MARDGSHPRGFLALLVIAGSITLLAAPTAGAEPLVVKKTKVLRGVDPIPQANAAAKKKGKRRRGATTETAEVPFAQGATASATAACKGKSHVTGGGFAVSPPSTPLGGIRSTSVISFPADRKQWTASGTSFTTPPASGTFTTYARCESNSLGRTIQLTLSGTVPQGQVITALLDCPGPTHAVGGGYAGTPPASGTFAMDGASLRTSILESRRRKVNQWAVTAYTGINSPVPAPFAGYVICERDGKGRNVSQESTQTQITSDGRSEANASCTGRRHVVSGGYAVADADPGSAVAAFFDESHPAGRKGWHVGMWEAAEVPTPAGATLETFAYCKRVPRAKKK